MLRIIGRPHKNVDQLIRSVPKTRFYCSKNVEPAAKEHAAKEPAASEPSAKEPGAAKEPKESIHRRMYEVTSFDRRILVWVGRYKTAGEIPKTVPVETIEKAKNKGRIKASNYMMVATAMGCILMAYLGKRAAERGESVHQMNLDWHQAVKEGKE